MVASGFPLADVSVVEILAFAAFLVVGLGVLGLTLYATWRVGRDAWSAADGPGRRRLLVVSAIGVLFVAATVVALESLGFGDR